MKLPKRFLFIPIVLLAFSYLFYSSYNDVKKRTLRDFNTQQFALARQASRAIESFFIYYHRELLFLSKLKDITELNDKGKYILENFYINHSDQIEAISVVDARGVLKYTFPKNDSAVGQNIMVQKHVSEIIQTHTPIVSDVFTAVQGYRAIAYHIPVFSEEQYKGSIAILIPLDKLGKRYIDNIRVGKTGYGSMISEEGIVLFNPIQLTEGKSVNEIYSSLPTALEIISKSAKETEGTSICYLPKDPDNNHKLIKTLTAYYRIALDNTYWTILIFTPEKEVYSTLNSFNNRLFMLFILIIIVMMTYFYLSLKASEILKEEKKRKTVENVLRESEIRFRKMFELSPAGIILIDEKGTIIEVNSSFCEILGYSKKEILGKNILLFAVPEKDMEIEKNMSKILAGSTLKHEVANRKKDGSICIVQLYETKIIMPDGKPGILSVSNDITLIKKSQLELIAAKEKAEESDKLKSAFLANMSHELRTPLNAIIGFSSLITESEHEKEFINYAKIILNSGQHLLSLVEDIFDTSMIETGQVKIKLEKTDIISVLYEAKNIILGDMLREKKSEVELILKLKPQEDHLFINTDNRKLKQVLINLLKNALKFTDKGYIEFGFSEINESSGKLIQFYVKDTGIGIEKIHHDAIFKVFRQLDDTHTRKFGGMGLGLSIAEKILEKLNGKIWVESEPGKGSIFYFTIPALSDN